MRKRIFQILTIAVCFSLMVISCDEKEEGAAYTYTSRVTLDGTSLEADKYHTSLLFSTDGGDTFVQYPKVAVGQTYLAKAVVNGDTDITGENCFNVDWSSSNPKPQSQSGGVATFVLGSTNEISAVVEDIPAVAAEMAGTYTVVTDDWADYHAGDVLTIEAIDATHIRIVEYPGTSIDHAPLVITITDASTGAVAVESQYNGAYTDADPDEGDGETTSGSGVISSCRGTVELTLSFTLPCCGDFPDNVLSLEKEE